MSFRARKAKKALDEGQFVKERNAGESPRRCPSRKLPGRAGTGLLRTSLLKGLLK